MYSSNINAVFMGEEFSVKPRCSPFCDSSIRGFILDLMTVSINLVRIGITVIPL